MLELKWCFIDILFLILVMLEWFSYFLIMLCNILLFLLQATGPFYNVNIMLIKSFDKGFSSVIISLSPLSIRSLLPKQRLLVRKGFIVFQNSLFATMLVKDFRLFWQRIFLNGIFEWIQLCLSYLFLVSWVTCYLLLVSSKRRPTATPAEHLCVALATRELEVHSLL